LIGNKISILTQNDAMLSIIKKIDLIADSQSSVLLIGETGVGKEVFAEYVHYTSIRSQRRFVKLSLSALPSDLLASELFGHEKGSFTGANNIKKGLFEVAHKGSIFLDDIDDVPIDIQTKLLRVLESREIMRVGGTGVIPVDVRLISASKLDLKELVKQNLFRSDLYYRINVVPVRIPPLRDRKEDIPLLIEHFFKVYIPEKNIKIENEALDALVSYNWPGNVRELRNVVHRLSIFENGLIKLEDLPEDISKLDIFEHISRACHRCFSSKNIQYKEIIQCIENKMFKEALNKSSNNQTKAAKMLGLSLSTFRDKLKKNNLYLKKC